MLLPSALSCDMYAAQQQPKPQRPKLLSFTQYETTSLARSGPTGLLASCRALQSILGGPVQPVVSPLTASATIQSVNLPNPFAPRPRLQSPSRVFKRARGLNKRRRDDDDDDSSPNVPIDHMDIDTEQRSIYQTPKRLRRVPVEIPLGLGASDFESLITPHHPSQPSDQMDEDPPHLNPYDEYIPMADSYNQEEQVIWSSEEDHQILDTVLNKFNFSRREWNDCARQLGKDQDSIGRRFKMLMGEDNLCLRRGTGRMERPGLDVKSW